MFEIFKKRWQAFIFAFSVLGALFAGFQWVNSQLTTLKETPGKLTALGVRIKRLETRIEAECRHVGEFQVKDIDSLLRMAEQRQTELRMQRDQFFNIEKADREANPIFLTLADMERSWLEITRFLRQEQRRYHNIQISCLSEQDRVENSGDEQ